MQVGPAIDVNTAFIDSVVGLLNGIYPVLIIVALFLVLLSIFSRDWSKAIHALGMFFISTLVMRVLPAFLAVTGPAATAAFDPLATLERHIQAILFTFFASISSAGLFVFGRYVHRKRRQHVERNRNRQAESTIRFEYSEWLEEEALKLEIEVLSVRGDRKIQALLERVREASTNNLRYLQAQHEEPVLRDAIQKEWDQLRQELNTEGSLFPAFTSAHEADFRKTTKGF